MNQSHNFYAAMLIYFATFIPTLCATDLTIYITQEPDQRPKAALKKTIHKNKMKIMHDYVDLDQCITNLFWTDQVISILQQLLGKNEIEDLLQVIYDNRVIIKYYDEQSGIKTKAFGGSSIDKALFDYIRTILPEGKTVLELGSGWATGQFSQHYTVYSVEHNPKWVGSYNSNYIYAPIKNGWYDVDTLKKKLPAKYDLILVDGPPGTIGREKFYTYLELFKTDIPIILDDVNRKAEYDLMMKVSQKLNRPFKIFTNQSGKKFGVILP